MKRLAEGFHRTFVPHQENGLFFTHLVPWLLAFTMVGLGVLVMQLSDGADYDFNLHYFGAILERDGTYTDFGRLVDVMREAGVRVASEPIYGTPTLVALFYQPLSFLDLDTAHVLWGIFCTLSITVAVRSATNSKIWPLWAGLITWAPPMLLSLRLGNISTLTFALIVLTYGCLRRDRQRAAGIALGIATAFKLYPGFLVIALLVTKQYKALAWTIGTCGVLFLATIPALGVEDIEPALRSMQDVAGFVHPYYDNASLPGVLLRATESVTFAKTASVAFLLVGVGVVYQLRAQPPHIVLAAGATAMLLAQSISWRHYFPLVLLLLLAIREVTKSKVVWGVALASFAVATEWVNPLHQYDVINAVTALLYAGGSVALITLLVLVTSNAKTETPASPPLAVSAAARVDPGTLSSGFDSETPAASGPPSTRNSRTHSQLSEFPDDHANDPDQEHSDGH